MRYVVIFIFVVVVGENRLSAQDSIQVSHRRHAATTQGVSVQPDAFPAHPSPALPIVDGAATADTFSPASQPSSPIGETVPQASFQGVEPTPMESTVIRNHNFFGVDPDCCCDEWAGFCDCGGLKVNPGHWGRKWVRGNDPCDRSERPCGLLGKWLR